MRRRSADTGLIDMAAATAAVACFAFAPWAYVGDARSGLAWVLDGRWPIAIPILACLATAWLARGGFATARARCAFSGLGAAALLLYGFFPFDGRPSLALGFGAAVTGSALVWQAARALAAAGAFKADRWVATTTVSIFAAVVLFVLFPVVQALLAAFFDRNGSFDLTLVLQRFTARDIWATDCL